MCSKHEAVRHKLLYKYREDFYPSISPLVQWNMTYLSVFWTQWKIFLPCGLLNWLTFAWLHARDYYYSLRCYLLHYIFFVRKWVWNLWYICWYNRRRLGSLYISSLWIFVGYPFKLSTCYNIVVYVLVSWHRPICMLWTYGRHRETLDLIRFTRSEKWDWSTVI